MSGNITIKLEIGSDLKETIIALLEAVDNENNRLSDDRDILSPGDEVKKAFGINLTDAVKYVISLKNE